MRETHDFSYALESFISMFKGVSKLDARKVKSARKQYYVLSNSNGRQAHQAYQVIDFLAPPFLTNISDVDRYALGKMAPQEQNMMPSGGVVAADEMLNITAQCSLRDSNSYHNRSPSMMIVVNLEDGAEEFGDNFETSYFDLFSGKEADRDPLPESPRSVIPAISHQKSSCGTITSLTDLLVAKAVGSDGSPGKKGCGHRRAQNCALSAKDFERSVFPQLSEHDLKNAMKTESEISKEECRKQKQKALVLENLVFPIFVNETSAA